MFQRYTIRSVLSFISILLLLGQFATAIHATDHLFHTEDDLCEVFTALEKTSDGLLDSCPSREYGNLPNLIQSKIPDAVITTAPQLYFSRAPPTV